MDNKKASEIDKIVKLYINEQGNGVYVSVNWSKDNNKWVGEIRNNIGSEKEPIIELYSPIRSNGSRNFTIKCLDNMAKQKGWKYA